MYVNVFNELPSISIQVDFVGHKDVSKAKCRNIHMWTAFEQPLETYRIYVYIYSTCVLTFVKQRVGFDFYDNTYYSVGLLLKPFEKYIQ